MSNLQGREEMEERKGDIKMKPERALTKVCPWAMSRHQTEEWNSNCVAGHCMAWEWIDENETLGFCILIEGKERMENEIAKAIRDTLISPNVPNSNWENANVVDVLNEIAMAIYEKG